MRNFLASILLTLLPVIVLAQPGVAWEALSDPEREALAPLQDEWAELHPRRQQRLRDGVIRWQMLDQDERDVLTQRMEQWRERSPEQRDLIRDRFERFGELPPEQQSALRERFREFQSLPEERRRVLRDEFRRRGTADPAAPGGFGPPRRMQGAPPPRLR